MAFPNKGSSIFEYGSHLPLIKLSGYTLCIEILIKKYLISIKNDKRYDELLLFLFKTVHSTHCDTDSIKEVSLNHLLTQVQTSIPDIGHQIASYVYNQLRSILTDDSMDLFQYFETQLRPLIPPQVGIDEDDAIYLSKSSLLGIFHRKLMICYNHASFATLDKFLKNIQTYYDNAGLSGSRNNKENHNILNELKYPYDLDENIYKLCKNSNDNIHQNIYKDATLFELMSASFPDLPSTHYLNCVRHMQNGEYIASLSYLHKYFDFVASSFKINWNGIINNSRKHNKINQKQYQTLLQDKRKKMQYSLLCRAMFYAYFGHYNLAIQQITEALQRAQNIGDRTCVASAMFILVSILSQQSGNVNLIKQIYENCIQNVEAIPSVDIGSLIGLSQWNLYHISVYHTKSRPWYLWQYVYFAKQMIVRHTNDTLYKYFGRLHSLTANAYNLYGNNALSSISYQILMLNHVNLVHTNELYTNITSYLRYHCEHKEAIEILSNMKQSNANNVILNQMSLILLLREAIDGGDLKLASIYQTRLAELIPSAKDNFFLYLEMMYLHSQIRFQHEQYMEASRIVNNLISLCAQRSLECMTIPYYLLAAKIHLKSHSETTQVMSHILRAWSICKSYHFYYWLPECAIFLAKLHFKLNNIQLSFNLIQEHVPHIAKKRNHLICEAYLILARCCLVQSQFIDAIQYCHIARIWSRKVKAKQQLQTEIYYLLARLYQAIGDTTNRDKAAQKMLDIA
eukprot:483371_1